MANGMGQKSTATTKGVKGEKTMESKVGATLQNVRVKEACNENHVFSLEIINNY